MYSMYSHGHTSISVQRQQFIATGCAVSSISAGKSVWRQQLQSNSLLAQSGIDTSPRSQNYWQTVSVS
ncbi:hypothetical protein [Escherichia coli]|uniref:hypothetical protein n=1 Tax=Escherichia coli TaxID=562 RepID=UPI000AD3A605|nr:hypothetical protein [Escherichia coli]